VVLVEQRKNTLTASAQAMPVSLRLNSGQVLKVERMISVRIRAMWRRVLCDDVKFPLITSLFFFILRSASVN
jgi:hypothetical protein